MSSNSSLASSQTSLSSSSQTAFKEVYDFYCVNDFHGSILERNQGRYYEAGIRKYFGHLEELKAADPEHTIILSSGDMFQGSLESNINYGALITEAMNAIPFDAMAVGNHEFDYGISPLENIIEIADFPVLAGNIRRVKGIEDLGDDPRFDISTTITRAGHKIGIIGMIGEGQTTSITSSHVLDLNFDNPENYALSESIRLKQEGCDIVILLIHADASSVQRWATSSRLKNYFDGVFCGHSHSSNNTNIGGVMAVQSYCNGEAYSHIQLELTNEGVKTKSAGLVTASKNYKESEKISQIVDKYLQKEEYLWRANSVAGTLYNGSLDTTQISDLAVEAIYTKYVKEYPDLVLAMQNKMRAVTYEGEITYSQLYKAMPFTNNIVIAKALGQDIINEAQYNETYTADKSTYASLDPNQHYTIAVINYLFYHCNVEKKYDYFSDLNYGESCVYAEYVDHPVDITYEYIKNELNGEVDATLYRGQKDRGFNLYRS